MLITFIHAKATKPADQIELQDGLSKVYFTSVNQREKPDFRCAILGPNMVEKSLKHGSFESLIKTKLESNKKNNIER